MRSIWADFLASLGQKRGAAGRRGRRRVAGGWGSCEGLEGRILPTTVTWTVNEGDLDNFGFEFTATDLGLSELELYTSSSGTIEAVNHPVNPTYYILYPDWHDILDGPANLPPIAIMGEDSSGNSGSLTVNFVVANVAPQFTDDYGDPGDLELPVEVDQGEPAVQYGYWFDPGLDGDGTTITASIGTVTMDFYGVYGPFGMWTWELPSASTSQTVTLTATDKDGGTTEASFDLIVNNQPPLLAVNWNWVYAPEGETAWVTGTWSDPGGDVVSLTCDRGAIVQNPDGTWLWTFDSTDGPDESGMVTITATDNEGAINTASFHLEIGNQAPTIGVDADRLPFSADEFVTMTGIWSDPGIDEVTLTASLGTVVKNPNGTWTWTYQTDENTPDLQLVWIQAIDESGDESWAYFDLESTNPGPSNLVVFGGAVAVGEVFSLRGSFVDSNSSDEHWVKIVWGDGLTETHVLPMGSRSFSFDHTYDAESSGEPSGEYSLAVSVSDDGGVTWHGSDSVTRESILPNGEQGDSDSVRASISADGRFVAFSSYSQNFDPNDTSWYNDIFLRDRLTGTLITVSKGMGGAVPNGGSFDPSISADGRYIAFSSLASNLIPDDTNESEDIFVFDRVTGTIELVSVDSDENPSNSYSYLPSISSDGRFVAFVSGSDLLDPADSNSRDDVFVRDRLTGTTVMISVDPLGNAGDQDSYEPSISADGRYVSFTSYATNLVSDDTNEEPDIFVRDLMAGTTIRVSVDSLGNQNNDHLFQSTISSDGRYVSFIAHDQNLDPLDSNPDYDAYVRDLMTGVTVCVSRDSSGLQPNDGVEWASISGDGRFVVFSTSADNLFPGDNEWSEDVFLVDRTTGSMVLITQGMFGDLENGDSIEPRISSDGRYIVLTSYADNLIPGDTNLNLDVFVFANPMLPLVGVKVTTTNHAPVLDNSGSPVLDGVGLNASAVSIAGTLVSDLIARMGPSGGITDSDAGALFGIAVNATSGNGTGTWQYSIDGGMTWENVGAVSNDGARLLAADAETRIRYVPNAGFIGEVKIAFTAWDQTVGSNGGLGITKNRGGGSTFSIAYEYASLFVTNSAPVLDASGSPTLDAILGGVANANNPGTLISDLIARMGSGGGITDANPGSQFGIAINGLSGTATGVWEYTVNNGTNWSPIGTTGNSNARLLAADLNTRIRYRPNVGFLGEVKIAFTAWDRTSGANGGVANIASRGGAMAFSSAYEYGSLFVVNGAPVLTPSNTAYLNAIPVNVSNGANVGTLVSDLITRIGFGGTSDPNPGALTGIAINGLGGTSSGTWEYSIDGGTSWSSVGTTGNANARLLAANANTRIRYVPNTGFTGSVKLAFVLWDQTSGVNGGVTNVGTRGGATAFSALYDYATLSVA